MGVDKTIVKSEIEPHPAHGNCKLTPEVVLPFDSLFLFVPRRVCSGEVGGQFLASPTSHSSAALDLQSSAHLEQDFKEG
jgi:hypothetical protein